MQTKLAAWGGYDTGKPRVRLLLDALEREGVLHSRDRIEVWDDVPDKSVAGISLLLRAAWRWVTGLPRAILALRNLPSDTHILLPYPGTPEVFLALWLRRCTRQKIILDAFLPIHNTIVEDRGMLRSGGLLARLVARFERAGLRRADVILVDTDAHGDFLSVAYEIEPERFVTVLVGAEPQFAPDAPMSPVDDLLPATGHGPVVLFYGQLIPLHGLETILAAVRKSAPGEFRWVLVGKGQQTPLLEAFMQEGSRDDVVHWPWVDYARLPSLIARADVGLGIFGGSGKASRVIPNKLFQMLAIGKRVVTRESPAVRNLARENPDLIHTIPPEDPDALLEAIRKLASERGVPVVTRRELSEFGPDAGVRQLLDRLGDG